MLMALESGRLRAMASNVPLHNLSPRSSLSKFSGRRHLPPYAAAQWQECRANKWCCCYRTVQSRNFGRSGGEGDEHTWQVSPGTRAGATAIAKSPNSGAYGSTRKLGMQRTIRARAKQLKKTTTFAAVSIIGPDSTQILFTVLTGCAATGQVLEARTKWGGRVSGPLLAMGAGVILSGAGVIPPASPVYDMVFSTIMPVGAALTLLETDVWSAFSEAGSTLKAFWFGAIGTILGTVLSFKLMGPLLGPDGWKIASSLCASYVGGTINYAATAQVLGLNSTHLLAAGMAADNLAMALYFGIIMSIPDDPKKDLPAVQGVTGPFDIQAKDQDQPTVESLAMSLAAATAACLIGDTLAALLPPSFAGSGLAIMAVVASVFNALAAQLFGSTGQKRVTIFAGSQILGGAVMLLFFAVVGASTGLREAMAGGWPLPIFIVILIVVHLITVISLGCWSKLPMRSILIASNANIGGPATAAAMANARCWPQLVRPALLVGTLGYTIGTAIGCIVGLRLLQSMF